MRFFADLHIHSHYSRATSSLLTLKNIAIWSAKKGIGVIGTGDFTHPGWLSEIEENLQEAEDGLYKLKDGLESAPDILEPRFVISGEISCIYKKKKRLRKIHILLLLPSIEDAKKLNKRLAKIGDLEADGRPILGLDAKVLLEIVLEICPKALFIPAHIWTPWFSLFGSNSGFDDIEECFEDLKTYIYALETGLSSDPPMNRLLSVLDSYVLVSNSDAHSLTKLGREANIFDTELSYSGIFKAIKEGEGFVGTVEFFPEEGKYHLDGHRKCGVCLEPKEAMALNNICPVCGNPLTIGVLHRVYELADRDKPVLKKPFYSLIPLAEIISEIMECGVETKRVKEEYERLISELGSELNILMNIPLDEIKECGGELLAEAIRRMRQQKVIKKPGFDGQYGRIRLFDEGEKRKFSGQTLLFGFLEKSRTKKYKREFLKIEKRKEAKSKDDPILKGLDPDQRKAVLYAPGHLLIVAGPGSGKTLTLTHRIAYMIESKEVSAKQVLAITFTNKAADEMRDRLKKLLSSHIKIRVSTFHSFCLWILREKGKLIGIKKDFSVCPEWETAEIIREIAPKKRLADSLLKVLSLIKHRLFKLADSELFSLYKSYEERLRSLNMLDIDDLEIKALLLLKEHKEVADYIAHIYRYIFVDEYQDTNPTQVDILKILAKAGSFVCAIGDPDQAIYGFRGADRSSFFMFSKDFKGASQIKLNNNYRSSDVIIKAASYVLEKEPMKVVSNLDGKIVISACASDKQEAEYVVENIERLIGGISHFSLDSRNIQFYEGESLGFGDIAVLYRINSIGDEVEEALNRAGIPVLRSGKLPLIETYPVNLIYWLMLTILYERSSCWERYRLLASKNGLIPISDPNSIRSDSVKELLEKIIKIHRLDSLDNEASIKALDKLRDMAEQYNGELASFLDQLSIERGIDSIELSADRVALMSIHSAKGLEWKAVFIIGCEDGIIPCTLFGDTDIDEEKRLFYVGMTRAKQFLFISYAAKRRLGSRILTLKPSPFLEKIPQQLVQIEDKRKVKKRKEPVQLSLFN